MLYEKLFFEFNNGNNNRKSGINKQQMLQQKSGVIKIDNSQFYVKTITMYSAAVVIDATDELHNPLQLILVTDNQNVSRVAVKLSQVLCEK